MTVRNHLHPAVALAIATKRRLGQRRSWRLPSCINYQEVHLSVECICDGAWGFSLGVGVFDLFDPAVLLHERPQGVHLLVLLGNIDEQPYKAYPPGRF